MYKSQFSKTLPQTMKRGNCIVCGTREGVLKRFTLPVFYGEHNLLTLIMNPFLRFNYGRKERICRRCFKNIMKEWVDSI